MNRKKDKAVKAWALKHRGKIQTDYVAKRPEHLPELENYKLVRVEIKELSE